jgi:hypothetical protein
MQLCHFVLQGLSSLPCGLNLHSSLLMVSNRFWPILWHAPTLFIQGRQLKLCAGIALLRSLFPANFGLC